LVVAGGHIPAGQETGRPMMTASSNWMRDGMDKVIPLSSPDRRGSSIGHAAIVLSAGTYSASGTLPSQKRKSDYAPIPEYFSSRKPTFSLLKGK